MTRMFINSIWYKLCDQNEMKYSISAAHSVWDESAIYYSAAWQLSEVPWNLILKTYNWADVYAFSFSTSVFSLLILGEIF